MQYCLESSTDLKLYLYKKRLTVCGRGTDSQKNTVMTMMMDSEHALICIQHERYHYQFCDTVN